ncbi:MAG TPA: hypothetical protein VML55_05980 [Planctomycetaceae bacterium]|nr:hypothetical protein [Planctomycetaceae bacterium]
MSAVVNALIDTLFYRTWWSYERDTASVFSEAYHWFNLLEAGVWFVFAALVLRRYWRRRHSQLELWYAFSFLTFGITDIREAWFQQSWLIWLKLVNLIVLLWIRRFVIRRYYPGSRIY